MAFGIFLNLYNPGHIICGEFGKIYYYKFDNGYDKDNIKIKNEEIVWYEISKTEPHKVSLVIPISQFVLVHRWHEFNYRENQKLWYEPEFLQDGFYINEHEHNLQVLIIKEGKTERIRLYGSQYYIVSYYLKYHNYNIEINERLLLGLGQKVKKQLESLDIDKIVSTLNIVSEEHFLYRHGDHDDKYYAEKKYSVNTNDPYINNFLPNKTIKLAEDSGFCMAWDLKCYPDELLGRQNEEEEELKRNFYKNYSKEEHFFTLLYRKLKKFLIAKDKYNNATLRLHEYFPCSFYKDELDYGPINRYDVESFVLSKNNKRN